MRVEYKQKCVRCKKNFVIVTRNTPYPTCHECQKGQMEKEITDPEMKKFFDIPEKFYTENQFLRNIKISYARYGQLTEKQRSAFEKTVIKMKEAKE
ncbi:hypothetical protein J4410_02805 [Candidatus Woesearchaeota archaeon]|nr:hypothetical protein [Candidatus Woesearchaeota archaeon]